MGGCFDEEAGTKIFVDIGRYGRHLGNHEKVSGRKPCVSTASQVLCFPILSALDYKSLIHVTCSFYEWRSPHRTMLSLSFLSLVWLSVINTPLWVLVKVTQLDAALIFFGTFPIASRMPQYRHLVSPLTWLFWKIPTDGRRSKSLCFHLFTHRC